MLDVDGKNLFHGCDREKRENTKRRNGKKGKTVQRPPEQERERDGATCAKPPRA